MSRIIEAGKAFVRLGTEGAIKPGLARAARSLKSFGGTILSVGKLGAGFGVAMGGAIAAATVKFAAAGDNLDKMSARTGASVEALSELGFAMEQSGSDSATLEKGLFGLSRAYFDLERGGAASKDAFGAIGIGLEDLQGLNAEDQLAKVADGLSGVEDMAKRGAIAQAIFGRAGRQMLPMLADGSAGMTKLRDEARALGVTIGGDQAKAAAQLTDSINRVKRALGGVVVQLGAAFGPALTAMLDEITPKLAAMGEWFRNSGADFFRRGLALAIEGIAGLATAWDYVVKAFKFVQLGIVAIAAGAVKAIQAAIAAYQKAKEFFTGEDPNSPKAIIAALRKRLAAAEAAGDTGAAANFRQLLKDAEKHVGEGGGGFLGAMSEELKKQGEKLHADLNKPNTTAESLKEAAARIRAAVNKPPEPPPTPEAEAEPVNQGLGTLGQTITNATGSGLSALTGGIAGVGDVIAKTQAAMNAGLEGVEVAQTAAMGTFSAAAAGRLGAAGGVDQKQLETMRKSEALLKKVLELWEKAQDNVLVWSR